MGHSPDRLLEEKTVFAEGLADPILATRCCHCLESPGTRHPCAPRSAWDFPTWPCPELRAWLMAGWAGLPVHTGAPGAGLVTSPGEGPDLGREAGG